MSAPSVPDDDLVKKITEHNEKARKALSKAKYWMIFAVIMQTISIVIQIIRFLEK